MLIRTGSLDLPKITTAIVDTDLALNHRIETLAALATALMAEVDRLRAEVLPRKEYQPNNNLEPDHRQGLVNDESIDFYREIEL